MRRERPRKSKADDRLVPDLAAFLNEQMCCGDLDTGLSAAAPQRIWVTCTCGTRVERPVVSPPGSAVN
jgi:hypothetical protein